MKIDQDYLKGLLDAFEATETPTTDISELKGRGFNYEEDTFLFHLKILADKNLIEQESGGGLGYRRLGDGGISWSVVGLRLTAQGHEFIEALNNSKVWDTIKSEFKDASVGTLLKVSKSMLEGYTKKKVTELINEI